MDLKRKYHSDQYRSTSYAAFEELAKYILELALASSRMRLRVREAGLGTGQAGIVEGASRELNKPRWDFELYDDQNNIAVCYVEATGDYEADRYARILSEKVDKALSSEAPVFFMYMKRSHLGTLRRPPKYFTAGTVKMHGELRNWKQSEKPYYFIDLRHGMTTRQFTKAVFTIWTERLKDGGEEWVVA